MESELQNQRQATDPDLNGPHPWTDWPKRNAFKNDTSSNANKTDNQRKTL